MTRTSTRRTPRWAVLCAVIGALLMTTSGAVVVAAELAVNRFSSSIQQGELFTESDEEPGGDIVGPLNLLLVGVDTRPSRPSDPPLADSIMIVHVPPGLERGYLVSLPRDTLVQIPPFPETGYQGGQGRINSAMSIGARAQPGEQLPDLERGFRLLAQTASQLTGIERFDAGAVIKFEGFVDVVDALGGITVELDEEIYSRHRMPDGTHRPLAANGDGFVGEQAYYPPGVNELEGWQALDIARQRYGVDGSDFGRQQNQQLILRGMLDKAFSRDLVTNPVAVDRVIRAAGEALVFDGRGHEPIDFAFALRELRPSRLVSLELPASSVGAGDGYQGEQLDPTALELFSALQRGQLDQFLLEHQDLLAD